MSSARAVARYPSAIKYSPESKSKVEYCARRGRTQIRGAPSQRATAALLNAIYEEEFLGFSYGFRPGRSQHDALDALWMGLMGKKVNWVLDADVRGFFDAIDHEWLVRFIEHRIADKRVVRHVKKWLKAGVLEDGKWLSSDEGTPQGGSISPLLANVYLHYVLDLWAQQWRRRHASGDMIVVRCADDVICWRWRRNASRWCSACSA
jgi:group II intron reverse transcriptase/maturase